MKIVTAIIKPFKLDDVRVALQGVGIAGITVTQVQGFGRQRGHGLVYRGPEYETRFIPKLKVEVLVPAELSLKVFETIITAAHTGQTGDGKVFVQDIEKVARIRTGERDQEALQ